MKEWLKHLLGLSSKLDNIGMLGEPDTHSFCVGQIYIMSPTNYSHTKKPYYIVIAEVGRGFIKTSIPQEHDLLIYKNTFEWGYHTNRMEFVGNYEDYGHLVYNQPLD